MKQKSRLKFLIRVVGLFVADYTGPIVDWSQS